MFRSTLIKWAAAAALGLAIPAFAVTMSKKAPAAKPVATASKTSLAPSSAKPKPAAVRLGQPTKKAATSTAKKSTKHPTTHVTSKKHSTTKAPVKPTTSKKPVKATSKAVTPKKSTVLSHGTLPLNK
jgi:hypothetical protein